MQFDMILARSKDGTIGLADGSLPWKQKADMIMFRKITTGRIVIVGCKTWDTFKNKPLPNRTMVVLTNSPQEESDKFTNSPEYCEGEFPLVIFTNSIDENAIRQICGVVNPEHIEDDKPIMVCGGAQIYNYALDSLDIHMIYVTEIGTTLNQPDNIRFDQSFTGEGFITLGSEFYVADDLNQFDYTFGIYMKQGATSESDIAEGQFTESDESYS